MPVRQQLCTCIMVTFHSEWDDYLFSQYHQLGVTIATNQMGGARASATTKLAHFCWFIPIPASKVFLFLDFLVYFRGECNSGLATFGTEPGEYERELFLAVRRIPVIKSIAHNPQLTTTTKTKLMQSCSPCLLFGSLALQVLYSLNALDDRWVYPFMHFVWCFLSLILWPNMVKRNGIYGYAMGDHQEPRHYLWWATLEPLRRTNKLGKQ